MIGCIANISVDTCLSSQASTEPDLIKWAIRQAKVKDFESISIATLDTDDPTTSFRRATSVTPSPYQLVYNFAGSLYYTILLIALFALGSIVAIL